MWTPELSKENRKRYLEDPYGDSSSEDISSSSSSSSSSSDSSDDEDNISYVKRDSDGFEYPAERMGLRYILMLKDLNRTIRKQLKGEKNSHSQLDSEMSQE